ncbi:MAG TPA: beta-galactosidase [Rhodothermales bacterium]|nr:beta-galactosidase [Rhodothermales bacterium]
MMDEQKTGRRRGLAETLGVVLIALGLAAWQKPTDAQIDALRKNGMGLVSQNRVVNEIGGMPVSLVYLRGDFREGGRPYLWPKLEPKEGVYDFSSIINSLNAAQAAGLKVGIRIMTAHPFVLRGHPEYPFFPSWIRHREVKKGARTAHAPEWENADVQLATRKLLTALGRAINDHPALQFVDVGVLGWVGEWHTTNGFYNADFMPSPATQKKYIDMHIDAFGAEKLLLNLGAMDPTILDYGLSRGINGVRQDCFGSTYHMRQYEAKLQAVPRLQRVIDTGMVVFEVCGIMHEWTHKPGDENDVTLSIREIMDVAIRWKATHFSNLGVAIPERYRAEYGRLQRAMTCYASKN